MRIIEVAPLVFKFGGSTFAENSDFNRVARYLTRRIRRHGQKVVVVTSAPSGMTESLRDRASHLSSSPSAEALDSLLPLADMTGMALLRIAIEAEGTKVSSLSGYQLNLVTDSVFSHAKIVSFNPDEIFQALETSDILVLPGGQGSTVDGKLSWLGKNSSDLTAVAVAAVVGASECEIFSDVSGVYSADPRMINNAQLLTALPYSDAINMSLSGAKVLHHGAVRYAQKHHVRIVCRLNREDYRSGTTIGLGSSVRAIVIDQRAKAYSFATVGERKEALSALADNNIPVVSVDSKSQCCDVITCGFFDVDSFFEHHQIAGIPQDKVLVSEFLGDEHIVRHLVDKETSIDRARALHENLFSHTPSQIRSTERIS